MSTRSRALSSKQPTNSRRRDARAPSGATAASNHEGLRSDHSWQLRHGPHTFNTSSQPMRAAPQQSPAKVRLRRCGNPCLARGEGGLRREASHRSVPPPHRIGLAAARPSTANCFG